LPSDDVGGSGKLKRGTDAHGAESVMEKGTKAPLLQFLKKNKCGSSKSTGKGGKRRKTETIRAPDAIDKITRGITWVKGRRILNEE